MGVRFYVRRGQRRVQRWTFGETYHPLVEKRSEISPDARARAAAGLRTSTAHARREEIGLGDVAPVIDLTKEMIEAPLA
jgi:hypothetical protein